MAKITISSGSKTGTKIVQNDNNKKDKTPVEKTKFDLDLSHKDKSLKPVPKEIITKFLKTGFEAIANKIGIDYNCMNMDNNIKLITIFTKDKKQGEFVLEAMSHKTAHTFGDFIEKETGVSKKKFYRTVTLFESTVDENRLTITWA